MNLPDQNSSSLSADIEIVRVGCLTYRLKTSQVLTIPQERAFAFFENPDNLFSITPDWLDFKRVDMKEKTEVFEGVEYDYTIKWLGFRIPWRSRIQDYTPPDRFTDIQIRGPYQHWKHLHLFETVPEGTKVSDAVTYRLPAPGIGQFVHRFIVKKQLEEIFRYRAQKIAEWARLESETE